MPPIPAHWVSKYKAKLRMYSNFQNFMCDLLSKLTLGWRPIERRSM